MHFGIWEKKKQKKKNVSLCAHSADVIQAKRFICSTENKPRGTNYTVDVFNEKCRGFTVFQKSSSEDAVLVL